MSKSQDAATDTAAATIDVAAVLDGIGPTLRRLRERRQLTLREVAERTRIGISTLSRMEAGKRTATLEYLLPLARLYNVALDEIVGAPPTGDPRVHPRTVRRHGMLYIALTHGGGPIHAFKMVIPPRADPTPPQKHRGYEWLYVLSGSLDLELAGRHIALSVGEAAEFDTREPHAMRAAGATPVEVLGLFSPHGERVHVNMEDETAS